MCTNPDKFWEMKGRYFSFTCLENRLNRFHNGKVKEFKDNSRGSFSISGGEPTLSKSLIPVIKKINFLFPDEKIVCLTNGRMFSYKKFAQTILDLDSNLNLVIPLHGHNSKIHDRITRVPGSFKETRKGVENILKLRKPNQIVEIRVVIHGQNYRFLKEITRFISKNFQGINHLVFIFFEIEGQAIKSLRKLRLTYRQLRPRINSIFGLIKSFPDVKFYHFPLCTLAPEFYPYVWRTLPNFEVSFTRSCKDCQLKEFCLGIHKGYLKYVGEDEFKPVTSRLKIQKTDNWYHPIKNIKEQ